MTDDTRPVNPRRKSAGGGYVKLHRSIWTDQEFTSLPDGTQRLYLLLISQPDVTHVGVLPLTPGRWSKLSPDSSAASMRDHLARLEAAQYIIIDHDTEEVLIRSHIVYDGAHQLTNGKTSLVNAYAKVHSDTLRGVIRTILATVDVTVDATLDATVDVSQQPAASSNEPSPSSQQPEPPIGSALLFLTDEQREAAAAAFEVWLKWRLKQPDVKFPDRLERTLRADAPTEWHGLIGAHFIEHPDAEANDVLFEVFRINPANGQKRAS